MKSHILSRLTCVCASIVVVCGALSWDAGTAIANPIGPGFDYLNTPPGGGLLPNLAEYGGPPTLPTPLEGRPLGPGYAGPGATPAIGNTDTIIQRLGTLPDGGTGVIPVEIVALSLESIAPVQIGASFFDVFVDLAPGPPSLGQVNILTHTPGPAGGGTFTSFFDVFARLTLTEVGNPGNVIQMNTPQIHMDTVTPATWSHVIGPPGYPGGPGYIPGPVNHTGPHPHTVPSSPEPGSLMLLTIAGLGLGLKARIRRR